MIMPAPPEMLKTGGAAGGGAGGGAVGGAGWPADGEPYLRGGAYWPLRIAETFGLEPVEFSRRFDTLSAGEAAVLVAYVQAREWEQARCR
jgi:hypothetical protein